LTSFLKCWCRSAISCLCLGFILWSVLKIHKSDL
jgi:hypothetical protein